MENKFHPPNPLSPKRASTVFELCSQNLLWRIRFCLVKAFFDLAAQGYPRSRVVLSEHFRCAPQIIGFSNNQFYNNQLIPLRLPTATERITPSLCDVHVQGQKIGKVNEKECDEIVRLVREFVSAAQGSPTPRSIGVISLVGNEQASLIRGRLLRNIGAQKMKEHAILVGDPSTFQGSERDIVYLSMVVSPGSVVTQTKLMHAQRMNVALSRARDQMVLVRSIDASDVPNGDDMKLPVIEFFEESKDGGRQSDDESDAEVGERHEMNSHSFQARAEKLLEKLLRKKGFSVSSMGVVWGDALCVEHPGSNSRAAICIENAGESKQEWLRTVNQQRSIERVGWKCLRLDGFSLLVDYETTLDKVISFLKAAGVEEPPMIYDSLDEEADAENADDEVEVDEGAHRAGGDEAMVRQPVDVVVAPALPAGNDTVVISSDDENIKKKESSSIVPDEVPSDPLGLARDDGIDASHFGEVVQLDFLRGSETVDSTMEDFDEDSQIERHTSGSTRSENSVSSRRRAHSSVSHSASRKRQNDKSGTSKEDIGEESDEEAGMLDDSETRSSSYKKQRPNSGSRSGKSLSSRRRDHSSDSHSTSRKRQIDTTTAESNINMAGAAPGPYNGDQAKAQSRANAKEHINEESDEEGSVGDRSGTSDKKSRKYRRLDRYSRDGRFYPGRAQAADEPHTYDTDSDLSPEDPSNPHDSRPDDDDDDEYKASSEE
mmetsp:Transcript_18851/g.39029  ORF Transcript_18851/g.39029 Transcript_18851/m.39029 type:complete len:716 (-) Transcript_18851:1208-3355(-)